MGKRETSFRETSCHSSLGALDNSREREREGETSSIRVAGGFKLEIKRPCRSQRAIIARSIGYRGGMPSILRDPCTDPFRLKAAYVIFRSGEAITEPDRPLVDASVQIKPSAGLRSRLLVFSWQASRSVSRADTLNEFTMGVSRLRNAL